jgi:hypothetical protein
MYRKAPKRAASDTHLEAALLETGDDLADEAVTSQCFPRWQIGKEARTRAGRRQACGPSVALMVVQNEEI